MMKPKKIGLALVLAGVAAGACADPAVPMEGFSYKGVMLGASIDAYRAALPDVRCTGVSCMYALSDCAPITGGSTQAFMDKLDACKARNSFGGVLVESTLARFADNGLESVYLTIPTPQMGSLLSAVVEKYGSPSADEATPFQTQAGAIFPNWQKTWIVGDSRMSVQLRSGRVDKGSVFITSTAALQRAIAKKGEAAKAGAKDF